MKALLPSVRFLAPAFALLMPALQDVVRADQITQTFSIPLTDTNWDSATASLAGKNPLVFQQFDPAAHPNQVLQSVDIQVTYGTTNTFSMTFTTPATISVSAVSPPDPNNPKEIFAPTVTTGANWPLSTFTPSLHVQDNGQLTKTETVGPGGTFPQVFTSADLGGPVNFGSTFTSPTIGTSSADFSKFVGSGTISFPFMAEGISTFSTSSGNGFGSVTTQADVTMTVTYNTTAPQYVPEPASMILLALGAFGYPLLRRKKVTGE